MKKSRRLLCEHRNILSDIEEPYIIEEKCFWCKPVRNVSNDAHIILQILNKMIYIKYIFKFPAHGRKNITIPIAGQEVQQCRKRSNEKIKIATSSVRIII